MVALFELNGVDGVRAQGVRLAAGLVRNPLSATWLIMFNFDEDCLGSLAARPARISCNH